MDLLYGFIIALSSYGLLVYVTVTVTKEKLNISNNMLGTGIATMFLGFLWNALLILKLVDENWPDDRASLYTVLSIICLLIGLTGIVLMAVGILKACRDE